jgi:hypothetical protein
LEHGIASNDNRLNDITVKGDIMFVTDGIQTRSQTQNQSPQWTNIPLLVKIYKLLVNELSNQIEANLALEEEEEEVCTVSVLSAVSCITLLSCAAYETILICSFN